MSYLDNTTITVDAVLTKKGRERFAAGAFNITKFALADDEIDYGLYNVAHPSGSDYYAIAIENLPLLEAIPDETKVMKYKVITLPKGTTQIPIISTGVTTLNLYGAYNSRPGQTVTISPSTVNGLNSTLGYTAVLDESYYLDLKVKEPVAGQIVPGTNLQGITIQPVKEIGASTTVVGKSFTLTAKALPQALWTEGFQTILTIHGNETGGSVVMTVNVWKDAKTANEF